ncbi:hypothetical protein QYS36_20440 [Pseudomonas sp. G34]|uniref:hypothetical protein n=1 Tax=Pseudomonas sp. G34 TaxID=3059083 RepID=UPI002808A798|nr:hypothetical protein [Pseudomonas sp. G34]MDQ7987317.1 hypothetical protein [Pseudomonas sp. G34]
MGYHTRKEVERLVDRLVERHDVLVKAMNGREEERLTENGLQPRITVNAEDIRFAVEDVATALKEIRSRLGKG